MPLIVNGGWSDAKLVGISRAANFYMQLSGYEVVGSDAKSMVRENPEIVRVLRDGSVDYEALTGARNRAHGAKKARPDGTIFVGIESGVMDIGFIVDFAVILVLANGEEFYATSTGLAFPREDYETARARGFDRHTVGEVVGARLGCPPTDPHQGLTGWARAETISDGLALAFGAMLKVRGRTLPPEVKPPPRGRGRGW